jgi:hypothetical protein
MVSADQILFLAHLLRQLAAVAVLHLTIRQALMVGLAAAVLVITQEQTTPAGLVHPVKVLQGAMVMLLLSVVAVAVAVHRLLD